MLKCDRAIICLIDGGTLHAIAEKGYNLPKTLDNLNFHINKDPLIGKSITMLTIDATTQLYTKKEDGLQIYETMAQHVLGLSCLHPWE